MGNRRNFFKAMGSFLTGTFLGGASGGGKSARAASSAEGVGPAPGQRVAPAPYFPFPGEPIRKEFEVVVVGGGIAGTTAAIAAARNGAKTALVHNRSMLGGNSSSEVKLFPENNCAHQPWVREGGIHEEFHTDERVRNHVEYREGTMNCHWDLTLYEKVLREENLTLFLNTHITHATMKNENRIEAVHGFQIGTEKFFTFAAPVFVDSTGDGYLGHKAGAEYRWGREARSEYGEPLAPEEANDEVMGNTLFFTAKDTGVPVPFDPPDWAVSFESDDELIERGHKYIDGGYWWIEVGAPYHPIKDNEEARHEGLRQLLGVWDHIKNKGDHGAENYGLEFVGFWPYKRECRRIVGDFVLDQNFIQNPTDLADSVAYGCWGIDIHCQGGILNRDEPPYPSPHTDPNWERLGALTYGIPLRALYSRNVENLMMAGRPISGSYLAFASTRVLSTGSIVGQAVGLASALCAQRGKTPRKVAQDDAKEIQQTLLREDCHIPGIVNEDPRDLARGATVSASSEAVLEFPEPTRSRDLKFANAQLFPVSADRIDRVELKLLSRLAADVELSVGLRQAPSVWDFRSTEDLVTATAVVPGKAESWVSFNLDAEVEPGQLYYVHAAPLPGVYWKGRYDDWEAPGQCPVGTTPADLPGKYRWRTLNQGHSSTIRVFPESRPYGPGNVNTGTNRPDGWTNIWISDPKRELPAWIELAWDRPQTFNQVQFTFDTNLLRRETAPFFRYPDCVKDYVVEARVDGTWKQVVEEKGNFTRRRVHRFERLTADRLRLRVLATNGAPTARVYEVRVYDEA